MGPTTERGERLWSPSAERRRRAHVSGFIERHGFSSYDELWRWSCEDATRADFWREVALDLAVPWRDAPRAMMETDPSTVVGVRWAPGATMNYAEAALASATRTPGAVAIVAHSDSRSPQELTWAQLRDRVARAREGLRRRGVRRGDVVAGYLPNCPETLVAMLASASLGATWTCCAPDTRAPAVLERFVQVRPKVLIAVDAYRYGERIFDVRSDAAAIREGLSSLVATVRLGYLSDGDLTAPPLGDEDKWESFDDLLSQPGELAFEALAFDHPLYVLYSSGTTGRPKAIVHSHGGITLEHAKVLRYHFDLDATSRFAWYTTTGWMMWNFLVSGLVVGASVALFDGDPVGSSAISWWSFLERERVTCAGVGASFLAAEMKAGRRVSELVNLEHLATLGVTGSPLSAEVGAWVYHHVATDILLASFSGGTDVCTGFVGATPLHDVVAGEIATRCLGARVEVFDDEGHSVRDEEGELVLTAPMPSMPVGFVDDDDDARYRAAYFERFPGVWAHGDRATLTTRGTVVITGRSDGTLNRGGVRMGTAEFYSVVEALDEVNDSLIVHVEDPTGGPGRLWLFVVVADGVDSASVEPLVTSTIRARLSPRHVPDEVVLVDEIPRTLTGKKLEVPIKRILAGAAPESVITAGSIARPESLADLVAATSRRGL